MVELVTFLATLSAQRCYATESKRNCCKLCSPHLTPRAVPERRRWREWAAWRLRAAKRTIETLHTFGKNASEKPATFAPFNLLATEGRTFFDREHLWHRNELRGLRLPPFAVTEYRTVDLTREDTWSAIVKWWSNLHGAEGIVIKPPGLLPRGKRGWRQPGLKCRTPDYLRLVYGSDYDWPENLQALRDSAALAHRRKKGKRITQELHLAARELDEFVRS